MSDIIAAVATGKVPCAIGILRLSGKGCSQVADRVFVPDCGKSVGQLKPRMLYLGKVYDRFGRIIDQAMAVYCPAPHSYTGEDTVELQCHGSPAMLSSALEALLAAGARQAGPGEFTKRAFLNGQLDLTQAEAVIDLIDAQTAEAAANAAGQLGGALLKQISPIYEDMTDLCSHFHAVLDYPDEDIADFELRELEATLNRSAAALEKLLATYERGRYLKQGVKAVLLGKPNVGKSSLLNALAGYDRVIVTEIAGTTRDTVEETVRLGKVLLRLTDTAGMRNAADRIEALGVERSRQAAKEAELAIFVCDGTAMPDGEDLLAMEAAKEAPCAIALINKTDEESPVAPGDLPFETVFSVSAKTGAGLEALKDFVEARFGGESAIDGSILTNPRQFGALRRAADAIVRAKGNAGLTPDALLTDVECAMEAMGEVIGRTVREDITDRIFERFCVGK